jgi:hypothetical protein
VTVMVRKAWWALPALAVAVACGSSNGAIRSDAGALDGTSSSSSGGSESGVEAAAPDAGSGSSGDGSSDGSPGDAGDAGDASALSCKVTAECDAGQSCLYPVGNCSAKGQCLALGSVCGLVVSYCGCDGTRVQGLCGPPYAYGPTLAPDASCPSGAGDAGTE